MSNPFQWLLDKMRRLFARKRAIFPPFSGSSTPSWNVTITPVATPAATLSSPTASATSSTTATLGVATNIGSGTLDWVVSTSSTPPSAAQIIAGHDSTGGAGAAAGSQAVIATGAQSVSVGGLTSSTTYYAYFVQVTGGGQSNVPAAASFTTSGTLTTPTFLVYSGSGSTSNIASYGSAETGLTPPPTFWFDIGADEGEGDVVEFQIDTANTYNTGNLRTESRILAWDGTLNGGAGGYKFMQDNGDGTLTAADFTIQTGLASSTTYYMRRRIRRDYGDTSVYSAWTSDVTASLAASSTAQLNTVNGTNKYSLLTVSGSPPLSFSSTAGNGYGSVRSTIEQASDYAQFEVTITSGASGDIIVGIEDGTANLTGSSLPGITTSTGIAVEFNAGAYIYVNWNSSGNSVALVNNVAGSVAVGDVFTIVWKKSTSQIEVYRTRSGTTTQMGTTQTVSSLTHHYAFAGINNTTSGCTMNFGASAYAKTPGSGVASYWA